MKGEAAPVSKHQDVKSHTVRGG